IVDEVQSAARRTEAHAVLSGTVRNVGQGTRLSLHLISKNGTDVLGKWALDLDVKTAAPQALAGKQLPALMYRALDSKTEGIDSLQMDPTMRDETARGYFNAGRGLLDRRSIADID